ncbi:right-handed parallel beta-helix repeat-containing protein, partial [Candidatus Marinimicrobia bacterium]|nr:right-handed parallel beta-helix repeat-containing protein [Candidatus Neomarinimicrobiota bacterium]
MAFRYKILIHLFWIIAVNDISYADIIIKKNTTWTRNRTLSENVIVQPNSVLTINAGVSIYVQNKVPNNEDTTRIQILVLGALNILGSADDLVYIGPRGTLSEKKYWDGIKFESSHSKSNINFLKISNAEKGLDIKSPIKVSNTKIQFCNNNGIYIESKNNDLIEIENVTISQCENVSLLIEKGNINLDWVDINRGGGVGLVNNTYGMVTINNMKVYRNLDNGIVNYGHLTASNIYISQNRHGLVLSPGISIITYADIINNRSNGILVGGGSKVNMEYCTIQTNGGYGLELTDWSENGHLNSWTKSSRPFIEISNSNFIDNYKTTVLDNFRYNNIWSNWSDIEYSGSGWVNNFERKIKREVPFGRIGWISFDYNSNDGGNEFSWQPCTGKSVWSPVFEVQNSREQTLTYLNAPFQCGWNSLAGKNSNSWLKYRKHTGLLDSTEQYVDWSIKKMNLVSSNDYYLKHYFKSTYLPSDDSVLVVKPAVENFQLRFYHGGEEISSYSNNDDVFLNNNYWSSSKNENRLINQHGKSDLAI